MTHLNRAVLALFVLSIFVSQSAVSAFAQTGDTDPNGVSPKTCVTIPMSIRYGDTNATTNGAVSMVQEFLINKGYMQGESTGYFGSVTFASVKKYQAVKNLTTSGYVGQLTRAAITSDSCSSDSTAGMASQTTNANTNTNTNNTNANTTIPSGASASTQTTDPSRAPIGILTSDGSNPRGCYIVLGKDTCSSVVKWSTLNYSSDKPVALVTCEVNSSGTCTSAESRYEGVKGIQSFELKNGIKRLFSLLGYDFLGNLYKTDEFTLKGECSSGTVWNGTVCASSGKTSNNTATSGQFVVGPSFGPSDGTSQPVTYGWYAWAGSMLLTQTPSNLGWAEPSVACNASTVGATYFLGVGSAGKNVVAQCIASNGDGITSDVPMTSSTLNQNGVSGGANTVSSGTSGGSTSKSGYTSNSAPGYAWEVYAGQGAMALASVYGKSDPSLRCDSSSYGVQLSLGSSSKAADVVVTCVKPGDSLDRYGRVVSINGTFTTVRKTSSSSSSQPANFVTGPTNSNNSVWYTWSVYVDTGYLHTWMSAKDLGFVEPSTACTAANVGATYYLGVAHGQGAGIEGKDMIAGCYSSAQTGTPMIPSLTSTTLNQPGKTTTGQTCSNVRGTFVSGNNTIEWVCGCDTAPADATGWVAQPSGCFQRVVPPAAASATTNTTSCQVTQGTFTSSSNQSIEWTCTCGTAPAGTGWGAQGNSCYQRVVPSSTTSTTGTSGYTPYDPSTGY